MQGFDAEKEKFEDIPGLQVGTYGLNSVYTQIFSRQMWDNIRAIEGSGDCPDGHVLQEVFSLERSMEFCYSS